MWFVCVSVVEERKEGRKDADLYERIYRPSLVPALLLTTIESREQQIFSHLTIGDCFSSMAKNFSSTGLNVRVEYLSRH